MELDDGYDAGDPYDQVALIYGIFMCESCPASFASINIDPSTRKSLPYHVVGSGARDAGWSVRVLGDNWQVLCPSCKIPSTNI
jgi:hypothetical protein